MAATYTSGTWMAALLRCGLQRPRVVASTTMTNCHQSSLPSKEGPASFHASHANTNTLSCRAHYSGRQPHLLFRLHLCLSAAFARDIHQEMECEHPQHCCTSEGPLLRPCHRHQRVWSGLFRHAGITTFVGAHHLPCSTATCSTQGNATSREAIDLPPPACRPF